jgi:hypothetical protein
LKNHEIIFVLSNITKSMLQFPFKLKFWICWIFTKKEYLKFNNSCIVGLNITRQI